MTTCQQTRISEVDSIAVGPQNVPYMCGQPATHRVYLDGVVHDMCEQCASDAIEQFGAIRTNKNKEIDAARLRELGVLLAEAMRDFTGHGEICRWLQEASLALDDMAQSLLEGKL